MDVKAVSQALVEACKGGTEAALLESHYAADVVSVEPYDMGGGRETHGIEGIKGKHAWWEETFEVHGLNIEGPFLHGEDRFAVTFEMDVTEKAKGERSQMKEVALYTVADGKIVREEFFY